MKDARLRLVIFDVDGTLVDSQADILSAMSAAFAGERLPMPHREQVLGIVGLSLPEAMLRLAPDRDEAVRARMVAGYKDAYMTLRARSGVAQSSPFYPGARAILDRLGAVPDVLLGVATGKSQRGLDKLIEGHGLQGVFVTRQVADHHPSKPHPAMIEAALSETGVDAQDAVMVGDTVYDLDMARAAGVTAIAVSWGYHPPDTLRHADAVIDAFDALPGVLNTMWGTVI
ncbi:HAD-IA family hydrolase [Roseovarius sp. SCSIO 43702]|uniref:HAD-IA family hydrolase n=1 Tax=Roseovarius sp. SCSIO 43702 TaxID=2823043 RepID=UPI001C72B3D0|nr:HAD-IA family hydrolase [Roseovarius sp. SCSIO 43702]QYX56736.1 HAD-IA family hydrolase [Roseovarius sp. SCSIO 43702]